MISKNIETYRLAHEAFNSRNFDETVRHFSPKCIYRDFPKNIEYRGPSDFQNFLKGWVNSFSNAQITDNRYLASGNFVISEFVGRGTNDGPIGEFPPTGRELLLPFCEILLFDESGQVISGRVYYDQLTLLSQLGLLERMSRNAA